MTLDAYVAPQQVVRYALQGRLPKAALASLLTPRARAPFYDACGTIEMRYTEECRAKGDPCLQAGCSAEGERCLEPILAAGIEYDKACGAVWATLFEDAANRDPGWRVTVSEFEVE
jgi:hypothetical protein